MDIHMVERKLIKTSSNILYYDLRETERFGPFFSSFPLSRSGKSMLCTVCH